MDITNIILDPGSAIVGSLAGVAISFGWKVINQAWNVFQISKTIDDAGNKYIKVTSNKMGLLFYKNILSKIKNEELRQKALQAADSQGDKVNEGWDAGIRGIKL